MKTLTSLLIILLTIPMVTLSQSKTETAYAYDAIHGIGSFAQIVSSNPDSADYLTFFYRQGYTIIHDVPERKLSTIPTTADIITFSGNPIDNQKLLNGLFNPFDADIQIQGYMAPKFRIGSTNSVLVFIDRVTFDLMYNDWRKTR